eukprot:3522791-Rhodomonas_salina.1
MLLDYRQDLQQDKSPNGLSYLPVLHDKSELDSSSEQPTAMALETAADTELRNLDSVVEDAFNRASLGRTQKSFREVVKHGSASVAKPSLPLTFGGASAAPSDSSSDL